MSFFFGRALEQLPCRRHLSAIPLPLIQLDSIYHLPVMLLITANTINRSLVNTQNPSHPYSLLVSLSMRNKRCRTLI